MTFHPQHARLRFWLAVMVLILALIVLISAMLPERRYQQVLPMPNIVLPTPAPTGLRVTWRGM